eukprot:4544070-Prymnesium_polylepis.2
MRNRREDAVLAAADVLKLGGPEDALRKVLLVVALGERVLAALLPLDRRRHELLRIGANAQNDAQQDQALQSEEERREERQRKRQPVEAEIQRDVDEALEVWAERERSDTAQRSRLEAIGARRRRVVEPLLIGRAVVVQLVWQRCQVQAVVVAVPTPDAH